MKVYWVVASLLLVVLTVVVALTMHWRWQQGQYFGEIVRISESELVIRDARVGEFPVHVSEETRIRRGSKNDQAVLTVGERVIVFGETRGDIVEATLIRVVRDSDWGSAAPSH